MVRKYILTVLNIAFLHLSANLGAQTPEYFQKLQTQRVESSDTIQWKQFGPGMAGYCEEFWCHPTDTNVMFMSPDMYNSYGSWDNGNSWQTIKDQDGTGKDMRRIQAIVFSHQDENFGYAIDVRGHLYKSIDKGRTWTKQKEMGGRHSELAVDPSDDNNWYIGAGDFWNVKFNHRSKANTLGYVYPYSAYGHIYSSTDKGATWKKRTTGLPSTLDVGRIIIDPGNSNNIIIATNSGVYRSTNMGQSWSESGTGLPNNLPRDMTYYYDKSKNEFILYVVLQTYYQANGSTVKSVGGVYKSTDGGINWIDITGNLALNLNQVTAWTTRDKYYKAIAHWFGISKDQAKANYPNYPSEILPVYNRIKVNPKNKNEVYIATNVKHDRTFGAGDVWKTSNGGTNWIATARTGSYWKGKKNQTYWTGRGNPLGMNTKFAHLNHHMEGGEEYFGNRFLEINAHGDVFICLDQQVLQSNNGGISWEQVDDFETEPGSKAWVGRGGSNLPGRFMLLETGVPGRKLFCSGEHGLWESASLGDFEDKTAISVKQIEGQNNKNAAHSIATVAVHPKNPKIMYILMFRQGHRGQFRMSSDGGKTWQNISKPINYSGNESGDMIFQYSLTVDYDNPKNIYFTVIENAPSEVSSNLQPDAFKDYGVYRSTDGGKNWTIENNGMPAGSSVARIKMDPDNSSVLYAALNSSKDGVPGGLYKTTDKGNNWFKITIPAVIKSVNNVFIDRNTKDIFISCGTRTGSMDEGGVWRSRDSGGSWEKIFWMPYIWQTETSPVNPELITVVAALPHENKGATTFNPGAHISTDDGKTWIKVNLNLGQPDEITDFKPDPNNHRILWCALKGSGWYKGVFKNSGISSVEGVNNKQKDKIILYPNPIHDELYVSGINEESKFTILTLSGVSLLKGNRLPLHLDQLPSGVYFLRIESGKSITMKRFIKCS